MNLDPPIKKHLIGLREARYQAFKPFPLTHYADISAFDSPTILGIVRDESMMQSAYPSFEAFNNLQFGCEEVDLGPY